MWRFLDAIREWIGRFVGALVVGLVDFFRDTIHSYQTAGPRRQVIIAMVLVVLCFVCIQAFAPKAGR